MFRRNWQLGVDFTNMFKHSFYAQRPQKHKKTVKSSIFFCNFGTKAAYKTLVTSASWSRIRHLASAISIPSSCAKMMALSRKWGFPQNFYLNSICLKYKSFEEAINLMGHEAVNVWWPILQIILGNGVARNLAWGCSWTILA